MDMCVWVGGGGGGHKVYLQMYYLKKQHDLLKKSGD